MENVLSDELMKQTKSISVFIQQVFLQQPSRGSQMIPKQRKVLCFGVCEYFSTSKNKKRKKMTSMADIKKKKRMSDPNTEHWRNCSKPIYPL